MWKIYRLTNLVTGKVYIGQTRSSIGVRMAGHRSDAKKYRTYPIHNSIYKHGWKSFKVDVIFDNLPTQKMADLYEKEMIIGLNSIYPNGYNLSSGGNKYKAHESTRKKHSIRMKNRIRDKAKVTAIDKNGITMSFYSAKDAADFFGIHNARVFCALKRYDRFYQGRYFVKPEEFSLFKPKGYLKPVTNAILVICKETKKEWALRCSTDAPLIGMQSSTVWRGIKNKVQSKLYSYKELSEIDFYNHPNKVLPQYRDGQF